VFVKVAKKSGKVAVLFDHIAEGLCVPRGTELQGFALAGTDGKWAWAKGEIKGKNRVVLSVPAGMNPVRIRYATQWPCAWANLFNSEGFPALGFESEIK
jgi:sialate O-acetylesterase